MSEPGPGHNSGIDATKLKDFARRVQTLVEERKTLNEDIKEVFGEAKNAGFDVKALRKAITLLNLEEQDRVQLGLYADALGVFG